MVLERQVINGAWLAEHFREAVQKGALEHDLQLSENAEFYVVNLLLSFEKAEHLFVMREDRFDVEPLAIAFSRAISGDKASQVRELKRLGDVALYVSGFFAEHLEKGVVGRDYYLDMGSSAYAALAGQFASDRIFTALYTELSGNFPQLAEILCELNITPYIPTNLGLLNLYERWLKTRNEKIRKRLVQEGLIPTNKKISC